MTELRRGLGSWHTLQMSCTRWIAGLSLVALAGGACSTDDSVLAKKPGGSGGSAGTGGGSQDAGLDSSQFDVLVDAPVEPVGDSVVTLLHGVVDAKRVGFCFLPVVAGIPGAASGMPLPAGGLAYGAAFSPSSIAGLDLAKDDVQPVVIAASESELKNRSCADLIAAGAVAVDAGSEAGSDAAADAGASDAAAGDAGGPSDAVADVPDPEPPPLRALALPVLPKKTLDSGYSTLLAAIGCMGGPGLDDVAIPSVCGLDYEPDKPTLRPIVVRLSRITAPERVSLQGVNARVIEEDVSIGSEPPGASSLPSITFAYNVPSGAVEPKVPYVQTNESLLGFPLGDPEITLSPGGVVTHRFGWSTALAAAGVNEVKNGRSYAVVALGPSLNLGVVKWWNPVAVVVIAASPAS